MLHIRKTRKERTFIKHNLLRLLHVVLPHRQVTKDREIVVTVVSDVKVDGFIRGFKFFFVIWMLLHKMPVILYSLSTKKVFVTKLSNLYETFKMTRERI